MAFRDLQHTVESMTEVLTARYPEMRMFYHNGTWTITRNGAKHRDTTLRGVLEEALHGALS